MILNREKGGYFLGAVVRLGGSFRIDGTDDPDVLRTGNSGCFEVVRADTGLFTVTFTGDEPIPELLTNWKIDIAQTVTPSAFVKPHMVLDSYSQVTRSFQIQCFDFSTPSATDPDDNDMISFEITGAIDSSGTDPA
jgi:hypothetical protein